MKGYLYSWRPSLLLCLGVLIQCGEAQVLTEAPDGPLYRVVGSPLFISCNVSGFKNERSQKQFEFRIRKPAKPDYDINIFSTQDQFFAFAVYADRVRNGDITVTYNNPNSVLFEIKSLEKEDEGDYECTAVNKESTYRGTYSAVTKVKVLDNSLSVSSSKSQLDPFIEGQGLELKCQAYSGTIQHTHLSFTWYLHVDGEDSPRTIISLDRDFTLSAGQEFAKRFQDGLVRLDKIEEATYVLNVHDLQVSDSGRIYCQAQEWIQDPDRSWYCITHKSSQEVTVVVKAKVVETETSPLVVTISTQQSVLHEGQELSLTCNIDTPNVKERFFSVACLKDNVQLAQIGPTGVLTVGPEYSGREKEGELRAARIGNRDYRFTLQPVRTTDHGDYMCRAWPQERGVDGTFSRGVAQDSKSQSVSISATESGISVGIEGISTVNEGDKLTLTCKVTGINGQLSVTWQHKASTSTASFTNVISLSQEGVMEKAGEFKSRKVRAQRPANDIFTLELDEVTLSDSGLYQCSVSEWKTGSKISSQSKSTTVTVTPLDTFMKVSLRSRSSRVIVGGNVELMCRITGPRMPITVTWSLQGTDKTLDNIMTLYSDGSISWSGNQNRYQVKVENSNNQVIHYLLINGASFREAGAYQCIVSVFLHNAYKRLPLSNQLDVVVQKPVYNLKLGGMDEQQLTVMEGDDLELKCSVISELVGPPSFYKVAWLYTRNATSIVNVPLVELDHKGLLRYPDNQALKGLQERLHLFRPTQGSFRLRIQKAHKEDGGTYQCHVEQHQWDQEGFWKEDVSENATPITLTVNVAERILSLEVEKRELTVMEGDDLVLQCNIISQLVSPPSFYKVGWLYTGDTTSTVNALIVELDHKGLLRYPENQALKGQQERFHLSRPNQSSFRLGIQKAHEEDAGTYQCYVEQHQWNEEGFWQQEVSEMASPVKLNINVTEKNFSLEMEEREELNVTGDFTIPCNIKRQSSNKSEFQVTWFWQKEKETKPHPIFTSYRNSTLGDRFGKDFQLTFHRPLSNQFNLKVLTPHHENSGLYFCEVEEWLPSLSRGWRKVAVEKSKSLTVNVQTHGYASFQAQCHTWVGILAAIIICALLVVIVLAVKMCQHSVSGGKKPTSSLWTETRPETLPLDTKPGVED